MDEYIANLPESLDESQGASYDSSRAKFFTPAYSKQNKEKAAQALLKMATTGNCSDLYTLTGAQQRCLFNGKLGGMVKKFANPSGHGDSRQTIDDLVSAFRSPGGAAYTDVFENEFTRKLLYGEQTKGTERSDKINTSDIDGIIGRVNELLSSAYEEDSCMSNLGLNAIAVIALEGAIKFLSHGDTTDKEVLAGINKLSEMIFKLERGSVVLQEMHPFKRTDSMHNR